MALTVPYLAFLWPYLIAVAILLYLAAAMVFHVLRFGTLTSASVAIAFIIIAGTALILFLSYRSLMLVEWSQSVDVVELLKSLYPF